MAGKRRGGKGKFALLIILVLLAAAGVFIYRSQNRQTVDYKEETAVVGNVDVTYSFTGEITAPNSETIHAEAAGTIRDVYVESNQSVSKGERMIRMEDGTTYKADIAGEIIALPVHKGDYVESDQVLATVTDLERLEVEISIDEYDVEAVSIGMPVSVSITALDRVSEGSITGLNKQADTSGQIAYYTATVQLETIPGILPGMQVEAVLVKQSAKNVVKIHAQALQFTDANEAYVLVSDGHGGETMRQVDTGLTDGIMVEIKSGLSAGDTVYYVGRDTSFEDLMRAFGGNRMNRGR
ncbi:MAG: HlyD family efflux transporter periplasmic adaptor subunit [Clostridia bacterium]|nr:HlyD family efflux transporter periplasmic adaptor subunit [Clostridia bacterium]